MPVYPTKNGGYRIMFDFNGHHYSQRLDKTYTKAKAEALEIKWKHDLMFEKFGVEKKDETKTFTEINALRRVADLAPQGRNCGQGW